MRPDQGISSAPSSETRKLPKKTFREVLEGDPEDNQGMHTIGLGRGR